MGPLGIHHPHALVQPGRQTRRHSLATVRSSAVKLGTVEALHLLGGHAAAALLLHPGGQMARAVAEQTIAGKGSLMHGLAVQKVHPTDGGAPALQKRGDQQGGGKWTELRGDDVHLQGEMAAQGRVAAAHQPPAGDASSSQGRRQSPADLAHPLGGSLGGQGPGVGQQKQQRRGVLQPRRQGGRIPAQQQGAAVHRLGAGGVIVDDQDLEGGGHGTIVP